MTPIRIIAADDESGVLFLLRSIINKLDGFQFVGGAENASDTLQLVKEHKPDIALLDIQLPDMIGIELAERLREQKPDLYIVFITAYKDYSLDAFRLYAYDYILKPIDRERVTTTIRRIQQIIQTPENVLSKLASHLQTSRMALNLANERVVVNVNKICYLEKNGRHTLIHCVNEQLKTRETLRDLEQRLGPGFFRSHKSYIINIERVERVVNLKSSSYYEVKFKDYKSSALLSSDRVHTLSVDIENNDTIIKNTINYLEGKGILPNDADLYRHVTLNLEDVNELDANAPKNNRIAGHIIQFRHKFNNIPITSTNIGDYINVYIDSDGIYSLEKNWSITNYNKEEKSNKINSFIEKDNAKKTALEYLKSIIDNCPDDIIANTELVYAKNNELDNSFVPAWEFYLANGSGYVHINAVTGQIMNNK